MARQTVAIPHAGDQSDFSMSRHISPVLKSTFGWKIGVLKLTDGGDKGYSAPNSIHNLNRPPIAVKL